MLLSPIVGASARMPDRWAFLKATASAIALALLAALLLRAAKETGSTNSYALLAEAFLHGRLYVDRCFDIDCAVFAGRTYIVFPPVPALVTLPFVAVFGAAFSGFIALGAAATALTGLLWWRIWSKVDLLGGVDPARDDRRFWLLIATLAGSPLLYVTLRSDGVWFFAQTIGFLFATLAIHQAVHRRLVLAGLALGLAFLSRQMTILLAPFLFVLALRADERLFGFDQRWLARALALGLPLACAVLVYLGYNYARFGAPLETGYGYILSDPNTYIGRRLTEAGLFSSRYVLFNAVYLFLQGFHADFGGPLMTRLAGLDPNGASLLAASPFLLLAFFLPAQRKALIGLACAGVMIGVGLLYHSNGFSQYNAQRYALDWLPVLLTFLPLCLTSERLPVFRLLVTYAVALNLATLVVLAVTKTA